jgi:hypothetical protein
MLYHSPWIIHGATHKIVDGLLTFILRVGLWPCRDHFYSQQPPIRYLWISGVAEPFDYTRCPTKHRWHSVDTLLMWCGCSVEALLMLCWHSVNTLLTLCWRSVDALLTFCWRSVDVLLTLCWSSFGGVAVLTHTILPVKAANTSIIDKSSSTAFWLHKIQPTKSLSLCWCSFFDWGSDHVAITLAQNGCQYVDYGYMA